MNYLTDHSYEELEDTIIKKAEELGGAFDHYSIYHTSKEIKLEEHHVAVDWKYTAFEPKQAIWNRIAEYKKPEYFEAKRTLATKIRKNMNKLDNMKMVLYEKI